jgi:WD40 repeat protein
MRLLFFLLLTAPLLLFAQKNEPNYYQNSIPVQAQSNALANASSCYFRQLDAGMAAQKRADWRAALRFFREAKNCPEVLRNERRQRELDGRIAYCEQRVTNPKANTTRAVLAEIEPRRRYQAERGFLQNTDEKCFQITFEQAERAYRGGYWDDAAALFRAAKNCADANQQTRQQMNERIIACRDAAEDELRRKEQQAIREARQAIASNRADDAEELLKNEDRSLAFRLADFANQYIAPDDNADCVQAMFDAWYYTPSEKSKHREGELYRPVFCYELADNLGENVQLKFEKQKDGTQWLWAFVPKSGDMFAWEMPSMKLVQIFGTGEGNNGYEGFDFAPDGETMLFWGKRFFELRRGTRTFRLEVPSVAKWCFDPKGQEFFYEDPDPREQRIYALNVREVFAQYARKGSKNTNTYTLPVTPREFVSGVPAGLLAMRYEAGKMWLGFRDRVEVLGKSGAGRPWQREAVYAFGEAVKLSEQFSNNDLWMQILPKERLAILTSLFETWSVSMPQGIDNQPVNPKVQALQDVRPLGLSQKGDQMALTKWGGASGDEFWLFNPQEGDTLLRQASVSLTDWAIKYSAFSDDGQWFCAPSNSGDVYVWALQDAPTSRSAQLPTRLHDWISLSPDGNRVFAAVLDSLAVYDMDAAGSEPIFWHKGTSYRGVSDEWAFVQASPDSAELRHLSDEGRRYRFPLRNPDSLAFLFAVSEGYVAYLTQWNRVEVRELKTGRLAAARTFEGAGSYIGELRFVRGSQDLVVVQHTAAGENEIDYSNVKIWSPLRVGEKPRALRLQDYPVRELALDPKGQLGAFSNGQDIRVFDFQNPENELFRIKITQFEEIDAIAFHPNSNLLAAALLTGEVIFWDLGTGQAALRLQAFPPAELVRWYKAVASIGFSDGGARLRLATTDGQIFSLEIDPYFIRSVAQDEHRHLVSFSSEHIRRYNLESALYYPGNFERLAESGDAPLVRSFFLHFQQQADESNNIERVREYCQRALYLYERLSANAQETWRDNIAEMYTGYALKLLFRNDLDEAASVIAFMQQRFGGDESWIKSHLALMRRDFPAAARDYTKFFLVREEDGWPMLTPAGWLAGSVEGILLQLVDYELLDSIQVDCFCSMVSLSGVFETLCPGGKAHPVRFLSPADRSRWEIYQKRRAANESARHAVKAAQLEAALRQARQAADIEPIVKEVVAADLAEVYRNWGIFEENSPEAAAHFAQASRLLEEWGAFKNAPDTLRLSLLTSNYLTWGAYLSKAGKFGEAAETLNLGLYAAQRFAELVSDTAALRPYYDHFVGPLYEQYGTARLLAGAPEEAQKSYEQAAVYFLTYGLNSLYLGNVAAVQNDDIQAFIEYGSILNAQQAGLALTTLDRLGEQMPAEQVRLDSFAERLRGTLGRTLKLEAGLAEMDYWRAHYHAQYAGAKGDWEAALEWATRTLRATEQILNLPDPAEDWRARWLDEYLNQSYRLLFARWRDEAALSQSIRYAEQAEAFLADSSTSIYYPSRELLKTNLAHALVLRNQAGDRARAIEAYRAFLASHADARGYDNWDLLQKDFRDLHRAGVQWPDLRGLIEQIKPAEVALDAADWKALLE